MTAILMRRTVAGLSPDDDAATAVLRRIKPGETVMVDVRRPRNLSAHRRWFALCNLIYQNSDEYPSPDVVHGMLKIMAGHGTPIVNKATGETYLVPGSISFAAMSEDEFQAVWRRAVDAVVLQVLPGVTAPEIEQEILRVVGLAG